MNEKEIYKKAIDKWGIIPQITMAIEEMSELTKVLCKLLRYKDFTPKKDGLCSVRQGDLISEITDVKIMLEQMIYHYKIEAHVVVQMNGKLHRLEERIKNE